jgi:hypothetical protein
MHVELNSAVCTETVCLRKKPTVGSPLSTIDSNVNVTNMSTSDQPLRIARKTNKKPIKGLKIAHINICSLRNKVHEIDNLLTSENINILGISETHLDNSFDDAVVTIHGYRICRKDRNANGEVLPCMSRVIFLLG